MGESSQTEAKDGVCTLFVDGQDVNRVSIHSVRNACAYVPQDNFLFSDTIAHNIAFGVDDATPEDIERAASLADVRDNIVDFKDGYETVLGERGVTVSGGQKQRVAIARALAMDPEILLFDEPTSALDPEMINEVLDVMVELANEGMTMMVVTHEMGFARKVANRVIFMDEGKIVEDADKEAFFANPQSDRAKDFLAKILH